MIVSFGDKPTEDLYHGRATKRARRIPEDVHPPALRKLDMLNAAEELKDLRAPPGNRLKRLEGDLSEFHSIRVNDQWRVVFRWADGGVHDAKVTDYH